MLVCENKYIPKDDRNFFILIHIGLWQCVMEELSPNPDWNYIYTLACEQTIQGIIADGIGIYRKEHPELNITQAENDRFLSASAQIVRQNFKVNQVLAKLCKLFEEQHVQYVLLKGQAVAQYYPKPMLRCSGDIDFFMDDDNYALSLTLLTPIATNIEKEHEDKKHIGITIDDIEVELHAEEADYLECKDAFKQLLDEMLHKDVFRTYSCNGVSVNLAPSAFDVMYVFMHLASHYYSSGLGLRQICDCAMQLAKNNINVNQLHDYIRQLHLEKPWDMFLGFVQKYIGLDETVAYKNSINHQFNIVNTNKIWKDCKSSGNFGHKEQPEADMSSRKKVYQSAFWLSHNLAKKQWPFSRKKAILIIINFYLHYIKLFFCKIFHIGGQGFKSYDKK